MRSLCAIAILAFCHIATASPTANTKPLLIITSANLLAQAKIYGSTIHPALPVVYQTVTAKTTADDVKAIVGRAFNQQNVGAVLLFGDA